MLLILAIANFLCIVFRVKSIGSDVINALKQKKAGLQNESKCT